MSIVKRSDLKYSYTWTASAGDNPNLIGKADREKVSRKEGYEVLDFINSFAKQFNLNLAGALKVERMIHSAPSTLIKREDLITWINANWKNFNS